MSYTIKHISNFNCQQCGKAIIDTPGGGYITECEHYPLKKRTIEEEMSAALKEIETASYTINDSYYEELFRMQLKYKWIFLVFGFLSGILLMVIINI